MAHRYRSFKRLKMTPATARWIVNLLVDKTLRDHARRCVSALVRAGECSHAATGNLAVARLIESAITIGQRRARLDVPDDPTLALRLAERLYEHAGYAGAAGPAFLRLANEARAWAKRSPLERLAEAGLELD